VTGDTPQQVAKDLLFLSISTSAQSPLAALQEAGKFLWQKLFHSIFQSIH